MEILAERLQEICKNLINEYEIQQGIGLYQACENVANLLYDDFEERQEWLEGCISNDALVHLRARSIPNWVDNKHPIATS